ncbi:unnamed protein product, partial [Bemisia tabaci]
QKNRNRRKGVQREDSRCSTEALQEEEEGSASRNIEKCYTIKTSEVMGRYLVASKNIPAGEILMSVEPFVVGPSLDSREICLGCYVDLDQYTSKQRCDKCQWPVCDKKCKGYGEKYGHSREECDFLRNVPYTQSKTALNVIVPLRCLLLKTQTPEKWDDVLSMESHDEIRKNVPIIWQTNQTTIVEKILRAQEKSVFTEEEIHRICGILEVNAFEITVGDHGIRGLYPEAFLLAHDCIPNTSHYNNDQFLFEMRTTVPVRSGEILKTSYAYVLQGTMRRQDHLRESKFFHCICNRCKDPLECGSNLSTLICPICRKSTLLSTNPTNLEADWKCFNQSCDAYSKSGQKMKILMDRLYEEVESINGCDIQGYEEFLKKYEHFLSSSHYLMIGAKYSLCQLYGKIEDFMIHELSTEQLRRKISLCEEVLQVADIVSPGLSVLRGTVMYELHAPLMVLATRDFQSSNMSKDAIRNQLKKVKSLLVSSCKCLQNEPLSTHEGSIGQAAKEALEALKSWEKCLGRF